MVGQTSSKRVETERVVLVQCTSSKRAEPAPAGKLYDQSDYFCKQREYARTVADQWYIQSAKHGLIDQDTTVKPYDTRAEDIKQPETWATEIASELDGCHHGATVELLGGKAYANPLTPELERRGFDVVEPLRGLGIGERMQALAENCNHTLERF